MVQKNCIKNKIIIICGPTASGKTSLAIECAKKLNTEIISADSMNIYKGLDVGTAKPTKSEQNEVKHHLIDVVSPFDNFTVSDYKAKAEPIIQRLLSENKIPIICGGTGFYINSVLYDLSYGNGEGNLEVRSKYFKLAEEKGKEYVYNILKEIDPLTAEKLHFNDLKRVIRALEISANGTKKSDIKDDLEPKYDYRAYSINLERDVLYNRINTRVDSMIGNGLIDEVNGLLNGGVNVENQCMQGIGYKETVLYLKNQIDLDELKDLIKLNTRHYAKRQITFFKKLNINCLENDSYENMAKRIIESL